MLKSITRAVIAATVIAALLIPAVAAAKPILPDRTPFSVSGPLPGTAASAGLAHQDSAGSNPSFSWRDAAVGAAGMLILVGVGTGATLAVRRRAILS